MFVTVACHHDSHFIRLHLALHNQRILNQKERTLVIFLCQFLGICLEDDTHIVCIKSSAQELDYSS